MEYKLKKLNIYSIALELCNQIYNITKKFPNEEKFGITSQLQRAAASVGANIAEGYNRKTIKDRIHFYYISKGSISETIFFLDLSNHQEYMNEEICNELIQKYTDLDVKIYNYIQYLKK